MLENKLGITVDRVKQTTMPTWEVSHAHYQPLKEPSFNLKLSHLRYIFNPRFRVVEALVSQKQTHLVKEGSGWEKMQNARASGRGEA